MQTKLHSAVEWIPNINMGEDYDQKYVDAPIHYDALDNLASFFGRDMPVHRHAQCLQVHYIEEGAINFHIDDQLYQVQGPALFLTPPAVPHSFQTEDRAAGHVLTVHQSVVWKLMQGDLEIEQQLDLRSGTCITAQGLSQQQNSQWHKIEQTFANLSEEWSAGHTAKSLMLENLTCFLIIQIARLSARKAASSAVTNDDLRIFHQFSDQIELHFRDQWLLPEYTNAIGVSESRLNQICNNISNNSPKKIITERVLREVKRLLTFSGKSVNEICYELGFKDPAYFSRFFKNQTGVSPLGYRKNQHLG
jgi:AraC family transcriptional regulator, 4-hydroxyphenylacetate 3-monooxygenase operon regulatory protein